MPNTQKNRRRYDAEFKINAILDMWEHHLSFEETAQKYWPGLTRSVTRLLFSPETYFNNKRVLIMQFGTDQLINVSSKETMLNITQIDNELCLLNNKK